MKRILYISTARVALREPQIADVLAVSRRNNARVDVTGLLIVGGRRFMQVLEGPEAAVDATYARISVDPRHFATVVMADEPIGERSFSRWAMGWQSGGSGAAAAASAHDAMAALIAPIADPTLRAYFEGFRRLHARAA